jgi:hypothetical protein
MEANNNSGPGWVPVRSSSTGGSTLTNRERRAIFQRMIQLELDAGTLGWLRRRQLVRFAVGLGIPREDARRIIEETEFGPLDPTATIDAAAPTAPVAPLRLWLAVFFALGLGLLAQSLLRAWLF